MSPREELVAIAAEAVASLSGEALVRARLASVLSRSVFVFALGKAAAAMARGAVAALGPLPGVVAGLPGDDVPEGMEAVPGDHPVPGEASLRAGERLLAAAQALDRGQAALVLISGGGSALAEAPAPGWTLRDLADATRALLASGQPIEVINAERRRLSRLKGGGLARALGQRHVIALALSDVAGDDPAVIASGPLTPGFPVEILAGPGDLARAAAEAARRRGLPAEVLPFAAGDVESLARGWIARAGSDRLWIAPAEPTLHVPAGSGSGGRSQHLALLVARGVRGTGAAFLAAGSDGRDGPTDHAGAAVDGATDDGSLGPDLARFDAASACSRRGVALPRMNTGTNLADLHLLLGAGVRARGAALR